MARIAWLFAVLSAFVALASALSAPTFCKCTCFTNSTIIPLGPQSKPDGNGRRSEALFNTHSPAPRDPGSIASRASSSSCSQCNRAFCLDYNLPICKGAEEKDVVTMCFQRDSRKDQIIVWCFILGTAGLLGWTAVQKVLAVRAARAAGHARAPLLGSGPAGAARGGAPPPSLGGSGLFQRAATSVGLGSGGASGSLRSPLASPAATAGAAGQRGQYAPLSGSGD